MAAKAVSGVVLAGAEAPTPQTKVAIIRLSEHAMAGLSAALRETVSAKVSEPAMTSTTPPSTIATTLRASLAPVPAKGAAVASAYEAAQLCPSTMGPVVTICPARIRTSASLVR